MSGKTIISISFLGTTVIGSNHHHVYQSWEHKSQHQIRYNILLMDKFLNLKISISFFYIIQTKTIKFVLTNNSFSSSDSSESISSSKSSHSISSSFSSTLARSLGHMSVSLQSGSKYFSPLTHPCSSASAISGKFSRARFHIPTCRLHLFMCWTWVE